MSGIFDRLNNRSAGQSDTTLAPAAFGGFLLLKLAGLRTNAQLLADINAALAPGPNLDAEAQQDLLDITGYISDGTGEAGQVARLQRQCSMAGIWETGLGGITEAEARTITGVTYTF